MVEVIYLSGVIIFFILALFLIKPCGWSKLLGVVMLSLFSWIAVVGLIFSKYIEYYDA